MKLERDLLLVPQPATDRLGQLNHDVGAAGARLGDRNVAHIGNHRGDGVEQRSRDRQRAQVRSWFASGQPFLNYPSASNLRWLAEAGFELAEAHDPAAILEDQARRIADAFGLFGPPERCAERLLRAREEAGIEHVFLFPAHDLAGGYDMPEAPLQAFAKVIRPKLGG